MKTYNELRKTSGFQLANAQIALAKAVSHTLEENEESADEFAKRNEIDLKVIEEILLGDFKGSIEEYFNILSKTNYFFNDIDVVKE